MRREKKKCALNIPKLRGFVKRKQGDQILLIVMNKTVNSLCKFYITIGDTAF